eukprot:9436127-Pyramimonas_sp.AAC.1
MAKTVVVPLWETSTRQFRRAVQDALPEWAGAEFAMHAAYLGFKVGPARSRPNGLEQWQSIQRELVCGQSLGSVCK